MRGRPRRPRLWCVCLLLWAARDAGHGSAMASGELGSTVRNNSTNTTAAAAATQGDKARTDGAYNAVPSAEQTMMIQRALCVLVVVTALVVVYFVVRTIRMRRINRKNRKYGVLKTDLENMEMRPLDQEDDEEDETLFDIHHSRR
ncbi:membrane protein FAM174A-like [Hypanus sabinus]|uniref:membrane protein FAM174A-like n=1 Tax=Hypanus sabinus TaxID=79690 RepID=UPI0028C4DB38|nr:membrane protein FAM174A-like [Hypanus sabinus]